MTKIDEAYLDEQQAQDRMQKLLDCSVNLTAAVEAIRKSVVILGNRVSALELHAQHQDQARNTP